MGGGRGGGLGGGRGGGVGGGGGGGESGWKYTLKKSEYILLYSKYILL